MQLTTFLVIIQFAALAWLSWRAFESSMLLAPPLGTIMLMVAAAATGVWALTANRPGNFNIRPVPKASGVLVTSGPYRWIRHPMYSALLLYALGAALAASERGAWLALAALAGVLFTKSLLEERWMLAKEPSYRSYSELTKRFVPFVF